MTTPVTPSSSADDAIKAMSQMAATAAKLSTATQSFTMVLKAQDQETEAVKKVAQGSQVR